MTTIAYDSLNRRTAVIDPRLGPTTYQYDPVGNTTLVASGGKTVSFTYDATNRVIVKQPEGETGIGYTYDEGGIANSMGRLTTVIDSGGTTRFSYDPSGQVRASTKSIDGSMFTQSFAYDLAGNVTRMTYPDGSVATYAYTDAEYLSTLSLDGAMIAKWSNYDAGGKPRNVAYGNGVGTAYHYDDMGHLDSLSTAKGATTLQDLTYDWYSLPNTGGINVGRIDDHRANKVVGGCNTDETQWYEYDDIYRLTRAVGVWGDKKYDNYDLRGNPTTFGGLAQRTLVFDGQQVTSGTGLSGVTYEAGNMKHKVLDGTAWDYTWTTEGALATVLKNGILTASMTYDAVGQRVKKVYSPTAGGPAVTTTYIGKMYEKRVSDGSPERHTLHLFANGQLVASVTKTGNILTASNDANGWRAQWALGSMYDGRSVKGAVLKAVHSARALAAHSVVRRWFVPVILALLGLALLVVFARALIQGLFSRRFSPALRFAALTIALALGITACSNGGGRGSGRDALITGDTTKGPLPGTSFYHRNHINSSTVITDASGTEITRIVYLPFGEISQPNSAGVDAVTSKFTGKELDEETGLYYSGARYYDPAIGRFLSADSVVPSVTDGQAFNRYTYARNNPIVYVDPSGHAFEFIANAARAAANSVRAMGDAVGAAARWVGDKSVDVAHYFRDSAKYAALISVAMVHNKMAIAAFVVAVAVSIATLNPAPIQAYFMATAASIAAQSLALAAGVRNPTVLTAIAVFAAALGGGASPGDFLKAGGSWALSEALARAEGDNARKLAPLNALAIFLIVNGLSKAFGPKPPASNPREGGVGALANWSGDPPGEPTATDATAGGYAEVVVVGERLTTYGKFWRALEGYGVASTGAGAIYLGITLIAATAPTGVGLLFGFLLVGVGYGLVNVGVMHAIGQAPPLTTTVPPAYSGGDPPGGRRRVYRRRRRRLRDRLLTMNDVGLRIAGCAA